MAITIPDDMSMLKYVLAGTFYLLSVAFVYRSFYSMRIKSGE